MLVGGGQEGGLRAGTENMLHIVAIGMYYASPPILLLFLLLYFLVSDPIYILFLFIF